MTKGTLVTKKMRLADLQKADYNPRSITAEAMKGLKKSLTEFGLVQPIIWNKRSGNIVGGHQRYDAMVAQGMVDTEVVVVDLSDAKEKALNLVLNNHAIAGDFTEDAHLLLDEIKFDLGDELFEEMRLDTLKDSLVPLDNDDDNDGEGGDDDYNAEYEVAVECKNEAEQREVFRLMTEKGFPCRILTI
jgi:hypothetical protein